MIRPVILLVCQFVFSGLCVRASADDIRTVVLSGQQTPGTVSGTAFESFDNPAINATGHTAFFGFLAGADVSDRNNTGFWSEGDGSGIKLIARAGDSAPGTGNGVVFSPGFFGSRQLLSPLLNDAGQTAFGALLTGINVNANNNLGLWSEGAGSGLTLIAREGSAAPGTFGSYALVNEPVLNDIGQTAFMGTYNGFGVQRGIWLENAGTGLTLVAGEGQSAPGLGDGVAFFDFGGGPGGLPTVSLNNAGQTAFVGRFSGPGVTPSDNTGIWTGGPTSGLKLVARTGESAPGASGVDFTAFANPVLNDAGQTAFSAGFAETSGGGINGRGIWSEGRGDGLALVAMAGDPAPGVGGAVSFSSFVGLVLNGAGQVAFRGILAGDEVNSSNQFGIWSEGREGLTLVAREGDPAPGAPSGAYFSFLNNPAMNRAGQTAFLANLAGLGMDNEYRAGIWAQSRSGELTLIVRVGDGLDVDDGPDVDLRTVSSVSFYGGSGNEDGGPSAFNDCGQLVFVAGFTDGSFGVFVSDRVAVPECESSLLLTSLILGAAFPLRMRRSRQVS